MTNEIPQYTSAYTQEENRILHERMENASESELVDLIFMLLDLYPDEEKRKINDELNKFIKEITDRYKALNRYIELNKTIETWSQYLTALRQYNTALKARLAYKIYTKETLASSKKKPSIENFMLNKVEELQEINSSDDMIRQYLANENTKKGIKCPKAPKVYYANLSDIPATDYTPHQSLEKLGKETLKNLLVLLLQNVDNKGNENIAPLLILFFARIYSRENKKGKTKIPPFSTNIKSYQKLINESKLQLETLKECKAECDEEIVSISQTSKKF